MSSQVIQRMLGPDAGAAGARSGADGARAQATAIAKLIATMPRPVAELSGERNRPWDCRAPIVIVMMAAAAVLAGVSPAHSLAMARPISSP